MTPAQAMQELLEGHGNAFAVASNGVSMNRFEILNRSYVTAPMDKSAAANLAAWLIIVAGLERQDLAPVFGAAGVPMP